MPSDFNFKREIPLAQIYASIIQKPETEQAMHLKEVEKGRQQVDDIFKAIKQGQEIARNSIDLSAAKQQQKANEALAAEYQKMSEMDKPLTNSPIQQYGPSTPTPPQTTTVPVADGSSGIGIPNVRDAKTAQLMSPPSPEMPPQVRPLPPTPKPTQMVQPRRGNTEAGYTDMSRLLAKAAAADPRTAAREPIEAAFYKEKLKSGGNAYDVFADDMTDTRTGKSQKFWFDRTKRKMYYADGVTEVPPEETQFYQKTFSNRMIEGPNGYEMVPNIPGQVRAGSPIGREGVVSVGQLEKPQAERLDRIKSALEGDKLYDSSMGKLADLVQAEALLQTENWVGDSALLSNIAKGLGRDAGALSNQDLDRISVSPELKRRVLTKLNRWANGEFRNEDREDFKAAIKMGRLANTKIAKQRAGVFVGQANRVIKNLNPEFTKDYLYGGDAALEINADQGDGNAKIDALLDELMKQGGK